MRIAQCWDDSPENDVRLVEILRRFQAKATFNAILPSNGPRAKEAWLFNGRFQVRGLQLDELKELYKGFKVAGHGCFPLNRIPDDAKVRDELRETKRLIADEFGQKACGFAYPGGGFDARVKRLVRDAGFLYARTTRDAEGEIPLSDPFELPASCHFLSPHFQRKFEEARARDGVFYFWGHSYELMDDEAIWSAFEAKIAFLSSQSNCEWIDPADLFPNNGQGASEQ